MRKQHLVPLLASVAIHLLFIWAPHRRVVKQPTPSITSIELLTETETPKRKKTSKTHSKKSLLSKKKSTHQTKTASNSNQGLQAFAPQSYTQKKLINGKPQTNFAKENWGDKPVLKTLHSMDLPTYSASHYFFETLRDKLNKDIIYPPEYAKQNIQGRIWVHVLVNRKGQLLKIIDSSKNVPILETYVKLSIYRLLSNTLPKKHWYSKDENLALDFVFNFKTTRLDNQTTVQTARYVKNKFYFQRRNKIRNIHQELAEDYARYIPPIIPSPMGVPLIDFVQLYRMIEAWQGLDPLEKKRLRRKIESEKQFNQYQRAKVQHRTKVSY